MTAARILDRLTALMWLIALPSLVSAQPPSAERFAELLATARGHVGPAELVDADDVRMRNRDAVTFLFRDENGTLLSIVLDVDTASVLTSSVPKAAGLAKPKTLFERVTSFLGGNTSTPEAGEDVAEPEVPADATDGLGPDPSDPDTDPDPDPGKGDGPGRGRGGDKGGDQDGGPGRGNDRG